MIQSYFDAEKKAASAALAIGLVACTVSSAMLISAKPPFYTGLSVAFLIIGMIQIITGAGIARNSDLQAHDLQKLFSTLPAEFVALEAPRMEKVLQNFVRVKWAELGAILLGVILFLIHSEAVFLKGFGLGLFLQGLISLVFDFFAEKRAKQYAAFIATVQRSRHS